MPRPHVQIILGDHKIPAGLREAVRRTGASASFRPVGEALRGGISAGADAVVIVVPDNGQEIRRPLRVLFDRLADRPRATLVMSPGGGLVPKVAHPQTVPVTFGCSTDPGELSVRLATMLEMRASLDSLHGHMTATRRSEESATQRYTNQLRLASQVQRELIPATIPAFGPVSFSTVFRPAEYVSGDIYDVHRLDETHIAIAIADATGHGIPAALLTVFIKRALRGKEIENGGYRILRPDEVLARLNEELLDAELSDCSFVAATYAVLNTQTLELALARAGAPYPIVRRKDGTLELLRPAGGIVGISRHTQFALQTIQLAHGDALVMWSDGLERAVLPNPPSHGLTEVFSVAPAGLNGNGHHGGNGHLNGNGRHNGNGHHNGVGYRNGVGHHNGHGQPRGCPPDELVLTTPWCHTLRTRGLPAALDQINVRYDMLRRVGQRLDDLTVLAMQVEN